MLVEFARIPAVDHVCQPRDGQQRQRRLELVRNNQVANGGSHGDARDCERVWHSVDVLAQRLEVPRERAAINGNPLLQDESGPAKVGHLDILLVYRGNGKVWVSR